MSRRFPLFAASYAPHARHPPAVAKHMSYTRASWLAKNHVCGAADPTHGPAHHSRFACPNAMFDHRPSPFGWISRVVACRRSMERAIATACAYASAAHVLRGLLRSRRPGHPTAASRRWGRFNTERTSNKTVQISTCRGAATGWLMTSLPVGTDRVASLTWRLPPAARTASPSARPVGDKTHIAAKVGADIPSPPATPTAASPTADEHNREDDHDAVGAHTPIANGTAGGPGRRERNQASPSFETASFGETRVAASEKCSHLVRLFFDKASAKASCPCVRGSTYACAHAPRRL